MQKSAWASTEWRDNSIWSGVVAKTLLAIVWAELYFSGEYNFPLAIILMRRWTYLALLMKRLRIDKSDIESYCGP